MFTLKRVRKTKSLLPRPNIVAVALKAKLSAVQSAPFWTARSRH